MSVIKISKVLKRKEITNIVYKVKFIFFDFKLENKIKIISVDMNFSKKMDVRRKDF